MILKTRQTHSFLDVTTDEISTTIWKDNISDIDSHIDNLTEVLEILYDMKDKYVYINVIDKD